MKYNSRHIAAFTLMEALVTIVISGFIVVGIYELQTTLFSQQVQQGKRHERKAEVIRLYNALEQDIAQSHQVVRDDNSITCLANGNKVCYSFEEELITRSSESSTIRDTFHLGGQLKSSFWTEEVENGQVDYLDLSIQTELGQVVPMHFYRPTGVADLINEYFQNASR